MWLPQVTTGGTNGVDRVTPDRQGRLLQRRPAAERGHRRRHATSSRAPTATSGSSTSAPPNAIVRATSQLPPAVTTGAATNVTASSAQIDRHGQRPRRGEHGHGPVRDHAGARLDRRRRARARRATWRARCRRRSQGFRAGTDRLLPRGRDQQLRDQQRREPQLQDHRCQRQDDRETSASATSGSRSGSRRPRLPGRPSRGDRAGLEARPLEGGEAVVPALAVYIDRGTRQDAGSGAGTTMRGKLTVYVPNATASHLPAR